MEPSRYVIDPHRSLRGPVWPYHFINEDAQTRRDDVLPTVPRLVCGRAGPGTGLWTIAPQPDVRSA